MAFSDNHVTWDLYRDCFWVFRGLLKNARVSKGNSVYSKQTCFLLQWWWVWPWVTSPIWRRRVRRQATPRRGWWTCVLWRKLRSQHERLVGVRRRVVLICGLVTIVTGVHGVGRTAQEGKFGSSFDVFCSFSFLFHSPVLEPGLNLQREMSKTISLRCKYYGLHCSPFR